MCTSSGSRQELSNECSVFTLQSSATIQPRTSLSKACCDSLKPLIQSPPSKRAMMCRTTLSRFAKEMSPSSSSSIIDPPPDERDERADFLDRLDLGCLAYRKRISLQLKGKKKPPVEKVGFDAADTEHFKAWATNPQTPGVK